MTSMNEVSNWSIEALDEDNDRYFYHFSDVTHIERGLKNYVIGRKGTGKTAIAEYIRKQPKAKKISRLLSFKNFPFNSLYQHENKNYTAPNQYISMWEYVIYSCVCNMMSESVHVNYDARTELGRIFNVDVEKALSSAIQRISDRGFSLNLFGLAGEISPQNYQEVDQSNFDRKNEVLRRYIEQNICDSTYYVIFDALDEDYKDILQPDRKQKYFDLLIGLFKAAQNIRRYFENHNQAKIIPLVFLRDDIFDLCRDPDKNKWLDRAITLDWNISTLKSMMAFRLSRAIGPQSPIKSFDSIWSEFFDTHFIRAVRKEDIFKFMLRSTFNRPRDIIHYIRECAKISCHVGRPKISTTIIKEANLAQSQYMRREIVDEMYSVMDNVSEILDLLSSQRKAIFSQKEFGELYSEHFPHRRVEGGEYHLNATEVLRLLYHFNAVGNITAGNYQVYSYNSNSKKLNPKENICIHRGILKSLDIM